MEYETELSPMPASPMAGSVLVLWLVMSASVLIDAKSNAIGDWSEDVWTEQDTQVATLPVSHPHP